MTIQVSVRLVFGNEKIYPVCEKARMFAKLVKQKTLTREDIQKIKMLGFQIEVIAPNLGL